MPTISELKDAIKKYKGANCPSFSGKKKAKLEKMVNDLGLKVESKPKKAPAPKKAPEPKKEPAPKKDKIVVIKKKKAPKKAPAPAKMTKEEKFKEIMNYSGLRGEIFGRKKDILTQQDIKRQAMFKEIFAGQNTYADFIIENNKVKQIGENIIRTKPRRLIYEEKKKLKKERKKKLINEFDNFMK